MWLFLVSGVVVGYLVLKLVKLARADADLTVLGSKMKPQYFQGRVVWVTGASSGSTCGGISATTRLLDIRLSDRQCLTQH